MKFGHRNNLKRGLSLSCVVGLGMASALVCGVQGQEDDWRQFRGPQNSGLKLSANPPVELDEQRHIAWSTPLPGEGLSSPIVVGQNVFVTCSSGPKQEQLSTLCLDAATGATLWSRTFRATGRTMCHEKTSVAAPTPVSDGNAVYVLYSSNDLVAYALDGSLLWLRGLTKDYPNASNSLGMSSSPIIADGVLVVQIENDSQSYTLGIDRQSGENLWRLDRPKAANWTSPTSIDDEEGDVVFLQSSRGITAVRARTGEILDEYGDGASTIPSSARSGNELFVPSNGITNLKWNGDSNTLEQVWRAGRFRPGTASPVVIGNQVFIVNGAGVVTCAGRESGERLWQLRLAGPFSATPVATSTHLYLFNERGVAQVVAFREGTEPELVSEMELGETILGTPSISGDAIYVRSDNTLWKLAEPLVL